MLNITELNKETNLLSCLECGKCTAVCPVARIGKTFSPRSMMSSVVQGEYFELANDKRMWDCLTCGQCQPRCPHNIDFSAYCRTMRHSAVQNGNQGPLSHDGALQEIMELMSAKDLPLKRMEWIPKKAKTAKKGNVLYFVGCLPFYDAYFDHMNLNSVEIGKSVLKILNRLGIEPVVMDEERCCGHDLLWGGDVENFKKLAELNLKAIKKTGAKTILFSCAECYRTLSVEYAKYFEPLDVKMQHMAQFMDEQMKDGALKLKQNGHKTTFHDPCRLGRQMDVIDEPREVLKAVSGENFKEMAHHGQGALCCGTSSWVNCNLTSKKIQEMRLKEAKDTGAEVMVTACPKCRIHFECTKSNPDLPKKSRIEIKDLCVEAADAL